MLRARRSHTVVGTAAAVALVVLGTVVQGTVVLGQSVEGGAAHPAVLIRLYDTVTEDASARAAAIRTSVAIMETAGISVGWRDCGLGGADYPCRRLHGTQELIVRIVPAQVAATANTPALASTHETLGAPALQLGFAAVDAGGRTGVLATVFRDNLLRVAHRTGLAYNELLGRTIAHEIGHLLLRGAGHGSTGLMRAVWTDAELIQNRHDDWLFAPSERDRLEDGVRAAAED
jgi:hypothetical protein